MSLRIPKKIVRRWRGPKTDGSIDGRELHQFLEQLCDEFDKRVGDLSDAIPGYKQDFIEFKSLGPGKTVRAPLPKSLIERRPDSMEVLHRTGKGDVYPAGKELTDGRGNLVVITEADRGVEFRVRVYRLKPLSGK